MPQSLASIPVHLVFSTQHRQLSLDSEIRPALTAYLSAILRDLGCPQIALAVMADHLHLLFFLSRTRAIADVVRELKRASTRWIRDQGARHASFAWQRGYGAFAVSESQKDKTIRYIDAQVQHHRMLSFVDEYRRLLMAHRVEFDERYVWD